MNDKARACERIHNLLEVLHTEFTRDEFVADYAVLGLDAEAAKIRQSMDEMHAAMQVIYIKETPQVH